MCDFKLDCNSGEDEELAKICHHDDFVKSLLNTSSYTVKMMLNSKKKLEHNCLVAYNSYGYLLTKTNPPYNDLKFCERSHKCDCGQLKCRKYNYCVKIDQICDGIRHCLEGDDEYSCGKNLLYFNSLVLLLL